MAKWYDFFQISRSGYYSYLERYESQETEKIKLMAEVIQYTSNAFMATLELYGIKQSFSRVGMPCDNVWAESFFATLKKECIHFNHFATRDELRHTVFAWTNSFYNTRRVQARTMKNL